jgi:hypothetical protein
MCCTEKGISLLSEDDITQGIDPADDPIGVCRYARDACCRLKQRSLCTVNKPADIEWRWCAQAESECAIGVYDGLQDGCHCALDHAVSLLHQAVLADTPPDFTELARVIALSLGDRAVVIEVASPMMPSWWFRI